MKILASRSQEFSGDKKKALHQKKEDLLQALSDNFLSEVILPTFSIHADQISRSDIVSISEGSAGYEVQKPLISNINLLLSGSGRLAIIGPNGSGKSTLVKAILNDQSIHRIGTWLLPKPLEMGYLDQHYSTLDPDRTVLESLASQVNWLQPELRRHLNTFLFRKNEEVNVKVKSLSGGEKARLALALISANTPKLLILDEITNNIDLETKNHVIEVLKAYPGALIIISHDQDFLERLGSMGEYQLSNQ